MNKPQITIVCFIKAKPKTKNIVKDKLVNLAKMTRLETDNMNYDLHVSDSDDSLFIMRLPPKYMKTGEIRPLLTITCLSLILKTFLQNRMNCWNTLLTAKYVKL